MDIGQKLPALSRLFNPFSRRGVVWLWDYYPRVCLALTVVTASIGYLFLFLPPLLLLMLPGDIYAAIVAAESLGDWGLVLIQLFTFMLGGLFTYVLIKLRLPLPTGLELTRDKFPQLFESLDELRAAYGNPRIHRVVLRDSLDVRVVKTPRTGFPLVTTNTLVIGLQALQSMSPSYLRVQLARRVGQLSGKHNRITGWLYFLHDLWAQYQHGLQGPHPMLVQPICWFFRTYAPVYQVCAVGAIRQDELEADRYALDTVNEQETVEAIVHQIVTNDFLKNRYWPKVKQRVNSSGNPQFLPHAHLSAAIRNKMTKDDIKSSLLRAMNDDGDYRSDMPTFTERLANIGRSKPLAPKPLGETAGERYLGNALGKSISMFDKLWLKRHGTRGKTRA